MRVRATGWYYNGGGREWGRVMGMGSRGGRGGAGSLGGHMERAERAQTKLIRLSQSAERDTRRQMTERNAPCSLSGNREAGGSSKRN